MIRRQDYEYDDKMTVVIGHADINPIIMIMLLLNHTTTLIRYHEIGRVTEPSCKSSFVIKLGSSGEMVS
jgi:hypothetical protein